MKNYNKILEAVNRGIQLALDDFDDEEQVQNVKSKQVQNRDYTKEYLDLLRDEVVDLGLPSGTLWCKYNLDVDPNQLTTRKDWYGSYYAWGELEPNKTNVKGEIYFSQNNYKFGEGYEKLTKYCTKSDFGLLNGFNTFVDNLTELLPEDDAAYQNKKFYNFKFHIPTIDQFEELIKHTNNYWVNNYEPNKTIHNPEDDGGIQGLNGQIFEGKNGNQLFIPAAGSRSSFLSYDAGSHCRLWSSSLCLNNPGNAFYLFFKPQHINMSDFYRYCGYSNRPVINL